MISFFDSSVPEPTDLLRETIAEAFSDPISSRYRSAFNGGNPYILDMLAARYSLPREQVLCTTGATGALALIYRVMLRGGEHVLIERPGFDLFTDLAQAQGASVSHFDRVAQDGFAIDIHAIEAAIRPETRLIVLSDLHNPSGAYASEATIGALAKLAERRSIHIVVDEVYGDYVDVDMRRRAAASISPYLISISSLTKIFGLSTLRCGWIAGSAQVMTAIRGVSDRLEFGMSNLSHAVAALVMERADQFIQPGRALLSVARPVVRQRFAQWHAQGLIAGEVPDFGCIVFPQLVGVEDTRAFSERLFNRFGVIVAPGEFFGLPGHVRIGFARPLEELQQGFDALEKTLMRSHSAYDLCTPSPVRPEASD
ncbi:pyridoxal phosphate-dependent aminotransferase [Novosphingobium terrae]|uniref:pyridoxal phosphate-dependent aminotransferase n=1 Tax=Novosphingobium terrae TaxID=2726189 RepID=UPI001F12E470|nr:pyridoxal phosphate-dependent aminotransferase [Novosphingobium terrae]